MKSSHFFAITILIALILFTISGFFIPFSYKEVSSEYSQAGIITLPLPFKVTHIKTPESVKAIYMSSWVAGNEKMRSALVDLIEKTELNSIVIDIKD